MRTKKVKRIKLLKGEKFMFFLTIIFGCIILPASWVYTKALLTETNIELEKIEYKIDNGKVDNIQGIASESGLSYNNNNIKTISE